jgi:disulfide bond formation protein DsbB
MKTTRDERIARIVLGLGVMFVGSFSFYHVVIAGYLFGLLLIGIGLYPKSTEYPEDAAKASKADTAPAAKASAPKKAVRKKSARKN